MENLELVFPTLIGTENNWITIVLQIIVFLIIIGIVIKLLNLYFKNIELKKDPEKNQTEINNNLQKIDTIIRRFIKIGGIVFAIIIIAVILLNSFY